MLTDGDLQALWLTVRLAAIVTFILLLIGTPIAWWLARTKEIPEPYRAMGSLEFAKKLLNEARVAVSPGVGFGELGDTHVRFALIENEQRIRQAVRGIRDMFRKDGLIKIAA